MNQCEKILKYIEKHGSITPLEALMCCGCYRLSARILDLRKAGHDIKTELIVVKTSDGRNEKVGRYSLNG